jgi:hypothetical protein
MTDLRQVALDAYRAGDFAGRHIDAYWSKPQRTVYALMDI